ncbi:stage VI sporulation protein D [Virgibacillus doumboii]|uniref:stage VI sporulation protein D n=1 Tax=Virgibacillus doumboii TaxID=2697503 RepID=UPI001FE5DB17|nr:stage VI sporulation protein D [Virgibacillus doumboii]
MSNDREVFSFDLNESLYFERGQEVAEMVGISLDPEISIQPFNDYISIRGVIELRGTYQKEQFANPDDEDTLDFDDYHSRRYVEKVLEMDNGQSEFIHRFPVEISVPTYRVSDLNDVTVNIESFDYEIPNQSQLKLSSTIEISGISDQSEVTPELGADNETVFMPRGEESFSFDVKAEKETQNTDEMVNPEITPVLPPEIDTGNDESDDDESEERVLWKTKKSQSLAEFFAKDKPEESPEEESPSMQDYDNDYESVDYYESDDNQMEDVRYLADMFRSDDDESYAQMRLCIVQDSDTVESIADRYEISPLQLVNQNHLSNDSLEEGQLLYIPYKKKQ